LEGSGAVDHSEEHHEGFEEAAIGVEGHFPLISGLDTYIIEALADIKFCEVFSSAELRDKFGVLQLCHGPVVTYCMVYHYTKRAMLARLLANESPAIYVVHLNRYFVILP